MLTFIFNKFLSHKNLLSLRNSLPIPLFLAISACNSNALAANPNQASDPEVISAKVQAEQNVRRQRISRLRAKAKINETTRFIVQLKLPIVPQRRMAGKRNHALRAEKIEQTARRVRLRLKKSGAYNLRTFKNLGVLSIEGTEQVLDAVVQDPDVLTIFEDELKSISLTESSPLVGAAVACSEGNCGQGQTIAVLDTGTDLSHPFFSGRIVHQACFSTTSASTSSTSLCPNGNESQIGGNAGQACSSNIHGCEHGTHVAGIATGSGAAFGGVAPNASLMSIQVFSKFTGNVCTSAGYSSPCVFAYTSDLIAALDHIYAQRNNFNIAAINLSLGGGQYPGTCNNEPERPIIDLLKSADIAVIAASGNSGAVNGISSPACISSAFAVGATTKADAIPIYSNSSAELRLLAPGSFINSSLPGNHFGIQSGTSMAAPHVAGAIATIKSAIPDATLNQVISALTTTGAPIYDSRNGLTLPRIRVHDSILSFDDSPGVTISSPNYGATFVAGTPVSFSGQAIDDEDGDVSGSIIWTDDENNIFGNGPAATNSFCVGWNQVTATAVDSRGQQGSHEIALDIIPDGSNPSANGDSVQLDEDTSVLIDVIQNDSTIGADRILGITTYTQPTNGTATLSGNRVLYTPNENYYGSDSFTYSIDACHGGSGSAIVSISVASVNDAPNASNDVSSVAEDGSVDIDVLANDIDSENDLLVITTTTNPSHGNVIFTATSVTYTPLPDFNGTDHFTYTITDGNGGFSSAGVSVTVTAVGDVHYVPSEHGSIQSAITAAESGDVIVVDSGNYQELINFQDKAIELVSTSGPDSTVIDGNGTTASPVVHISDGSTLRGFTIKNGFRSSQGSAIRVAGDDVHIIGNIFTGNARRVVSAINFRVSIFGNIFHNNFCGSTSDSTLVVLGAAIIHNNIIHNQSCRALDLIGNSNTHYEVYNNTFVNNDSAIYISNGNSQDIFRNNIFAFNVNGVAASGTLAGEWENNLVYGNTFDYPLGQDLRGTNGNIEGNPRFVDQDNNWRLLPGSIAIDAGTNIGAPTVDFVGNLRPVDANNNQLAETDIGAFEYYRLGNRSPVANDDAVTLFRDEAITVDVLSNDSDVDFDDLIVTQVDNPPLGDATHDGSSVYYTPAAQFVGEEFFFYTISDGKGGSSTAKINVIVKEQNNIPPTIEITSPAHSFPAYSNDEVTFVGIASDVEDGDISDAITWHSNIDGEIGSGARLVTILSLGVHSITARVRDSGFDSSETGLAMSVRYRVFGPPRAHMERNGIAYFLSNFGTVNNHLFRYDLEHNHFLSDIIFDERPWGFYVDDDAVYVSFEEHIDRFSLDGTEHRQLIQFGSLIRPSTGAFLTYNGILYADLNGQIRSFNADTGSLIAWSSNRRGIRGASVSAVNQKIVFRSKNHSPSDIMYIDISLDGTSFGYPQDSPYHNDYPNADFTYLSPDEATVIDSSGTVYNVADLTFNNDLHVDGFFNDLVIGTPGLVVADDNVLRGYDYGYQPTGQFEVANSIKYLAHDGDDLIAFHLHRGNFLRANRIPFDALFPSPTGDPVDPTLVSFSPDEIEVDVERGVVYMLSRVHRSIFRWSLNSRNYLTTIPLSGTPDTLGLSTALNRLYIGYASGETKQIQLDFSLTETPFVSSGSAPQGIIGFDEFIYITDNGGSGDRRSVYEQDGNIVSATESNSGSNVYYWSAPHRKMYLFREYGASSQLYFETITTEGVIESGSGSFHNSSGFSKPILAAEDGTSILVGSGAVFDEETLTIRGNVDSGVVAAIWKQQENLYTVHHRNSLTELRGWDATTLEEIGASRFDGRPIGLYDLGSEILLIREIDSQPRFTFLSRNLDVDQDGLIDFVDSDDDNDGLVDWLEDVNLNGIVDAIETDPLNPDTDGDGVNDFSDLFPLDPARSNFPALQIPALPPIATFLMLLALCGFATKIERMRRQTTHRTNILRRSQKYDTKP